MYNYFILIGRVAREVEIRTTSDGRRVLNLTVACQRPFKNPNGEYDTDFFNITLWESMAENAAENFKKGSTIGIKGRLSQKKLTLENGVSVNTSELVGERIVFFSNANSDTEVEG